ncbi:hypothetical protein HID58_007575 [Brassica napus]|uniref:Uncharacterized protein n=1 Tax=Brassica napus TaxID=3708 RepID=A0ABQ8EEK4_BRANA|nr:hypothetical protein HID58_007575 [Brassica napus]
MEKELSAFARKGGLLAANVTPRLSCLQRKLHYFEFLSPLSETEEQGPVGSTEVNIGQAGVRRRNLILSINIDKNTERGLQLSEETLRRKGLKSLTSQAMLMWLIVVDSLRCQDV